MQLSDLVTFRNKLNELSLLPTQVNSDMDMNLVRNLMTQSPDQFKNFQSQIDQQANIIHEKFSDFESLLTQLKHEVNCLIVQEEKQWFQQSYDLYDKEMCNETTEYILNRKQTLSADIQELFTTRLRNYTDWRFPGLVVRPGLEKFVTTMVSNDPLYLVDQHRDLLQPTVDSFPQAYQRRLRCYVVNERKDNPILYKIPDNQFGICLVYNFFNFRPVELIRQWLTELFVKLKPGGVLIMTINDCDRESAVVLAQNAFACYTPGRMILTLAESIGFEVLYFWNDWGPVSWIELKRPGQLSSMRGGQTLAKIISKTVAESK